jgi:hypothetical protein
VNDGEDMHINHLFDGKGQPMLIQACIANERRATNGSPAPRAFTSEPPNISYTGIKKLTRRRTRWSIVFVASAFFLACFPGKVCSDDVETADEQSTVKFIFNKTPVLEYRYTGVPGKPYVARWLTPGGTNVLRDAPHDHLHHHGLMFAVGIDGVDFWSENPRCGRQQHRSLDRFVRGGCAGLTQEIDWVAPGADRPLASERRTIELAVDKEVSLLTWKARFEPGDGTTSVRFGGSHYFGLGMRFVESMDRGGRHFNSAGQAGEIFRGEERLVRARWCAYTADADGKPVTVAIFDDPQNPRHPATMFTMSRPFAYLSATLNLKAEPLSIQAGKPLVLRYGAALWDGAAAPEDVQRLYQKWAARE